MKFEEALKLMIAGEYVQRPEMVAAGEYCVVMPGMQYIWKIMTVPTPNAGNWLPAVHDIQADDWLVVDVAKPAIGVIPEEEPEAVAA